jgi:hypothetical protein
MKHMIYFAFSLARLFSKGDLRDNSNMCFRYQFTVEYNRTRGRSTAHAP